MLSPSVSSELLDWTQSLALKASSIATIKTMHSFASTDFRGELNSVKMPVLIVVGSDDKIVPIETGGENAAKMLPQAEYLVYDGAPHGLLITEKEQLSADLVSFVNKY